MFNKLQCLNALSETLYTVCLQQHKSLITFKPLLIVSVTKGGWYLSTLQTIFQHFSKNV